MTKLTVMLAAATAIALASPASAELGTNNPDDATLLTQRIGEATPAGAMGSGSFEILPPGPEQKFSPVSRVRRDKFGVVGPFMPNGLQPRDLDALVYPEATPSERQKLLEGLSFFTTFHTAAEGLGPLNNQPACIGCHLNAAEAVRSPGLLGPNCPAGSPCGSNVTRAARSTPTNFEFTSLNPATGGGRAPDSPDALFNTGKTAAFTVFGDFAPLFLDAAGNPGFLDPLDGSTRNIVTNLTSQPFGGLVQHVRPALPDLCVPKPIPPVAVDANLTGTQNPITGLWPSGFRRTVGELAGPPYIGRGLIEAVPTDDIIANADPSVENGNSSLGNFADLQCPMTGCISGKVNTIPRNFAVNTTGNNAGTVTGFVGGVGRFGLRANGAEILQFVIGGMQGELSFTTLINPAEANFPTLFPGGINTTPPTTESAQCMALRSETPGAPVNLSKLEVHLSTPFSVRNLIRNTAPPEFGDALLDVLSDVLRPPHSEKSWRPDSTESKVQRGAQLFGVDLVAFANRTVGRAMKAGSDGRDDNAIAKDRKLNCVGCHTPIQRTGQSPAATSPNGVGAEHLSYKWAPIFSDVLLHKMPVIKAEREAPMPRDVVVIRRLSSNDTGDNEDRYDDHGNRKGQDDDHGDGKSKGRISNTLDLPRNLANDTFLASKAVAEGSEFRTAPLMGLGRIGAPFLHDARVYLSKATVERTPAGTVTTNRRLTNAPLVVNSVDDAILAAIELHDLPTPDDNNTPDFPGAGCPVPSEPTNVTETAADICPSYDSPTSQINRSDAREVIYRFRQLSSDDQQAVIEFLKQL